MSDRIAVMDRGQILQIGTPAEIYGDPADRFVMEFIGSPNVFAGRVERFGAGVADVAIPAVGAVRARYAGRLEAGIAVAVLVRPECVRLSAVTPAAPGAPLTGQIAKIADLGFISHYFVRLADGQEALAYRLNGVEGGAMDRLEEGQRVYLWWDEKDARVFAAGTETQTAGMPANGPAR
jgi:ABC-type Fe3+/spermidine/putrescine transport system ATPase subunit